MRDEVLVLNFNDTASRAVTRKLRAERVLAKIVPGNTPPEEIRARQPLGLLLAGGTGNGASPVRLDPQLTDLGLPVLALGSAATALLEMLGGSAGGWIREPGMARLEGKENTPFACLDGTERMLPALRDYRFAPGICPLCTADGLPVGFGSADKPLYGVQFEVDAVDPDGALLLRQFALDVCCCSTWWDDDAFTQRAVEEIRRVVGTGRAVCAMTGGLDSGVSAMLAYKALGPQLECIFVDTGLLRFQEAQDFMAYYRDQLGMNISCVQAEKRFLSALRGVTDPDEKRRVIGDALQAVLNEEKSQLKPYDVLIRGTSYNDVMFGADEKKPILDEHVPAIEPVRELFKDEIRRVGDYLGIPGDLMSRQPFPGGGLAIRILGEATGERISLLRRADAIFRSEVQRSGSAKRLWQYFAVLCPMPEESDAAAVCLRAVQASEQSLAYAARLPYDVMEAATERILRELPQVRRVVYDLTPSTHYAGIEWQ